MRFAQFNASPYVHIDPLCRSWEDSAFDFMKRDCGKGELIPIRWKVIFCKGKSDKETEESFESKEAALAKFEQVVVMVRTEPCSDVRLYAIDREGYANCIKSLLHGFDGKFIETDRLQVC